MIIRSALSMKNGVDVATGTYVDIGAHHPVFLSNTYHFYCRGWRGLNVDARPGSADLFRLLRPDDVTVERAVSDRAGPPVRLYVFSEGGRETIDATIARQRIDAGEQLIREVEVPTTTPQQLMRDCWKHGSVDVLSVDVEGMDDRILRAWDWAAYRPQIVCFEPSEKDFSRVADSETVQYLVQLGFRLAGLCGDSVVMCDSSRQTSQNGSSDSLVSDADSQQ